MTSKVHDRKLVRVPHALRRPTSRTVVLFPLAVPANEPGVNAFCL
jgi:hypothetical protein